MKRHVIEIEDLKGLSPIFRGKAGHWLGKYAIRLFAMDRINEVYDHSCDYEGSDFAARLLNDLGVNYRIGNVERLPELPDGAFITVSNHPYGGLDGIMLIDLMAGIRPDYKLMVNQLLTYIKTMDVNFISVKPMITKKLESTSNFNGIHETLMQLRNGHPMGFFPSGAVSDFKIWGFRVRDREWQESIIKLIKSAKVPIVPIRFFDHNSPLFYFLGLINWRIRLVRMPYEVFNKKKQRPRIGIGQVITVEEQEQFLNLKTFGTFLRKKVYEMPMPASFTPRSIIEAPLKKLRKKFRIKSRPVALVSSDAPSN